MNEEDRILSMSEEQAQVALLLDRNEQDQYVDLMSDG